MCVCAFFLVKVKSFRNRKEVPPPKVQKSAPENGPGPGMYPVALKIGGPSFQFGARFDDKRRPPRSSQDGRRFDSTLRQKLHLKPNKVDGPGPGDYKLYDSVTTKYRAESSIQVSTWGTGRTIDYSPGKRKKAFYLPGPAHYNHVYPCQNEHRQFNKTSTLDEGYSFSKGPRDIQRRRYTEKEPPGAGTYEP